MCAGREESDMDFLVADNASMAVFGGILLTYKHFATIPAEVYNPLIYNNLHTPTRGIPKNCISLVFRVEQNWPQPVLTYSYIQNTILFIMISSARNHRNDRKSNQNHIKHQTF